jgi:hypothetical protein
MGAFCRAEHRRQRKKPPMRWLLFAAICDWDGIYFQSSKLAGMKWQEFAVIPEMGVTVLCD